MTAIVMNTLNGAVSEYGSGFDFHSITPTHAGTATGLYALGGNLDIAASIVATVATGKTLVGGSKKKLPDTMYFSIKGSGTSRATVIGEAATYNYAFSVLATGQSRAPLGRGIRENYLAFGYSNTDGAAFELDRIEVLMAESKNRRV